MNPLKHRLQHMTVGGQIWQINDWLWLPSPEEEDYPVGPAVTEDDDLLWQITLLWVTLTTLLFLRFWAEYLMGTNHDITHHFSTDVMSKGPVRVSSVTCTQWTAATMYFDVASPDGYKSRHHPSFQEWQAQSIRVSSVTSHPVDCCDNVFWLRITWWVQIMTSPIISGVSVVTWCLKPRPGQYGIICEVTPSGLWQQWRCVMWNMKIWWETSWFILQVLPSDGVISSIGWSITHLTRLWDQYRIVLSQQHSCSGPYLPGFLADFGPKIAASGVPPTSP
jgi:hypothetical protein